jgi:hypothetical protein
MSFRILCSNAFGHFQKKQLPLSGIDAAYHPYNDLIFG